MVKNKALPDSARPCRHPRLVILSLSLSLSPPPPPDLALSKLVSSVFSLSLADAIHPYPVDPAEAGPRHAWKHLFHVCWCQYGQNSVGDLHLLLLHSLLPSSVCIQEGGDAKRSPRVHLTWQPSSCSIPPPSTLTWDLLPATRWIRTKWLLCSTQWSSSCWILWSTASRIRKYRRLYEM